MLEQQQVCLRQLGGRRAAEVQFGRFLANAKVTPEKILAGAYARTAHAAAGRHVLAIQDTTELNYQALRRVRRCSARRESSPSWPTERATSTRSGLACPTSAHTCSPAPVTTGCWRAQTPPCIGGWAACPRKAFTALPCPRGRASAAPMWRKWLCARCN